MKTCPFCAEQIQDAAIKCKHCGSMVSAAPSRDAPPQADDRRERAPSPRLEREVGAADERGKRSDEDGARGRRRVLYSGHPSWRAYVGVYALIVAAGLAVPPGAWWIAAWAEAATATRVIAAGVPLLSAAAAFWVVGLWRRAKTVRISTTNIETEHGILSKRIDVLELWRCRDVRYRQSLLDRMLGIAHIEVFTKDVTTPNLSVVGLPASRQLFEQIRDSIEIQRHSRNVVGFVD